MDGDLLKTLVSPAQQGSPETCERSRRWCACIAPRTTSTTLHRRISQRPHLRCSKREPYRVPGNDTPAETIMSQYEVRDAGYEAAFRDRKEYADPEHRPARRGRAQSHPSSTARANGRTLRLDMVLDELEARIASLREVRDMALAVVTLFSRGGRGGAAAAQVRGGRSSRRCARGPREAERNAAAAEAANAPRRGSSR